MENSNIDVIIVGAGEMGKEAVRIFLERGFPIVAAVDPKPSLAGRDIAEAAGLPPVGVAIEADLAAALERTHPRLAFFAIDPGFRQLASDLILCANHHVNVITINMDVFCRVSETAHLFDCVDGAFKRNQVTLLASGINDIWWSGIGMDLCGTCRHIDAVDFTNKLPLENMSEQVGRDFHVNDTPEHYRRELKSIDLVREDSVQGPMLALLKNAEILGLTIDGDLDVNAEPILCPEDTYVSVWDSTIYKGRMQGQKFTVRASTREHIDLSTSMIIKVLDPGEQPSTSWDIKGEPDLHIELGDICGEITTAATPINRIPQVLAASPGILTLDALPERPPFGGVRSK